MHIHQQTKLAMNTKNRQKALFIFIVSTNLVQFVRSKYYCENNTYPSNTIYRVNVESLISSLPSNVPDSGFYYASAGITPDVVNLLFLCRGDLRLDACRSCARILAFDILRDCPTQKQAITYADYCMLRYSDQPIFGKLELSPGFHLGRHEKAANVEQFKFVVRRLLFRLRIEAASGLGKVGFAAGSSKGPDNQTIYALVQCTPDIDQMNCADCLRAAVEYLRTCCDGWRGVSVFRPSCTLRYDTQVFYNKSMFHQHLSPLPLPRGKDSARTRTIIIICVTVAGGVALVGGMYLVITRRRKHKVNRSHEISRGECLQYDLECIRDATNNFAEANKVGQGGFGIVYKGKLVDGQTVAVKKLSNWSEQGDLDFRNEVMLVGRLQHRNLVRLLGFCLKKTQRILVYEFLQNASLDLFIFDSIKRQMLDWNMRHNIIKGIAKGLVYLHEDSNLTIIHRDLKLSNILLDRDMNPKIADFGLARLLVRNATHESTSRVAGTYGYMSPEYVSQGHFSVKSDVFGYGIMVLEIISGQRNNFRDENENSEHLISYAWRNWQVGSAENVIDSCMRNSSGFEYDEIMRCIHISLLCVQENPVDRPSMASVLNMLSSSAAGLSAPSKPGFYLQGRLDGEAIESTTHESVVSRNYMSITDMHAR